MPRQRRLAAPQVARVVTMFQGSRPIAMPRFFVLAHHFPAIRMRSRLLLSLAAAVFFVAAVNAHAQFGAPSPGTQVHDATALRPPTVTGTGVYLNPQGIVNAASWAPFTAGIAPGELLTLFNGSNLAADTVVSGIPFLTSLDHVQVSIGGLPAPIYYVSPTQVSVIVPYAVAGPVALVQVTNNGVLSNAVPVFVNQTAPGVFTQTANGLSYGATEHVDGSIVTAANPAKIGETVAVFVTGLGAVTPTIADGAPGPTDTLSEVTPGSVTAAIGGVAATVTFAGLAPQLSGLYQIDITVPAGLTAGDNHLYISGPDAYNSQSLIPISTATSAPEAPAITPAAVLGKQPPGRLKVDPKTKRVPGPRSVGGK